ncbi:DnaJ sub B member 13 [Boothiomyces macroporosus]|uniref:Phosphatidate cytidylyltransferase, mitochondrial n=1 Tax=Boothiomyces macroporosus TaxID=261099 RepID=A0AAD5UR86_9FUNG|nr:DnaJ sub B member 13 [Boothiomyces macroporosus]KAJ3262081.1 DnaJ sub B member 13 [Boothiomyces macroporosus]
MLCKLIFKRNFSVASDPSLMEKLQGVINGFNAPIRYAVAYGSGAYEQKGYEKAKAGKRIKYGVVSMHHLLRDLEEWETLYLAGRLQKPVKILRDDAKVKLATKQNLENAVRVALLMLPERFTEEDLFLKIAGLSYRGDFRMLFGENPHKVYNIVYAQMDAFHEKYVDIITELPNVNYLADGSLEQDMSIKLRGNLIQKLPKNFQTLLQHHYLWSISKAGGKSVNREEPFYSQGIADSPYVSNCVAKTVRDIVGQPAITQSIKGIFTAGLSRTFKYSMEKFNKKLDYYKILNLKRDCEDAEIKAAYRKLSLKFHPERNSAPGTKQIFMNIAEAYDVLSNEFEGSMQGYEFHGDPEKVFNEFFGTKNPFADFFVGQVDSSNTATFGKKFNGLHGLASNNSIFAPTQDPTLEFDINLTLEELYTGALKKIKISRKLLNDDGMTTSVKEKILTVEISSGWRAGTKIIFPKEGDQGPNKIPSDVAFIVKETKHDRFTRKGDDLIFVAEIPLVNALIGHHVEVLTLDERILRIPVNETIKGEGMPNSKTKKKGDLIIKFKPTFPKSLTDQQKALLKNTFNMK